MKPFVYVASPYTKGDPCINTHVQMQTFNRLLNDGLVWPYVPLWSHFQHTCYPRPYTDWIEYDNAVIEQLGIDACLRINAEFPMMKYYVSESSGADGEVELFASMGKPVFYNIPDLYKWAKCFQSAERT
jgi:hypothetical protein